MAIRTMRLEKDEILRKKSREVDIIDDKIQTLIDDMIETMYKYNGVGLSAVQVGVLKRCSCNRYRRWRRCKSIYKS